MWSRYTYAMFRTLEAAKAALEEFFAIGEISEGERPRIERTAGGRWRITLMEVV